MGVAPDSPSLDSKRRQDSRSLDLLFQEETLGDSWSHEGQSTGQRSALRKKQPVGGYQSEVTCSFVRKFWPAMNDLKARQHTISKRRSAAAQRCIVKRLDHSWSKVLNKTAKLPHHSLSGIQMLSATALELEVESHKSRMIPKQFK